MLAFERLLPILEYVNPPWKESVAKAPPIWYEYRMTDIRPLVELMQFREQAGLSRKVLATNILTPPTTEATVWRWEHGERRPGRQYLKQLCKITGLSLVDLLGL